MISRIFFNHVKPFKFSLLAHEIITDPFSYQDKHRFLFVLFAWRLGKVKNLSSVEENNAFFRNVHSIQSRWKKETARYRWAERWEEDSLRSIISELTLLPIKIILCTLISSQSEKVTCARRIGRGVPPSSLRAYRPSSSPRAITDTTHRQAAPTSPYACVTCVYNPYSTTHRPHSSSSDRQV